MPDGDPNRNRDRRDVSSNVELDRRLSNSSQNGIGKVLVWGIEESPP